MVSEAIEEIRAAETKAAERTRAAHAEAKTLVSDARETAERSLDGARKAVRGREADLLEEARSQGAREGERIRAESGALVEAVRSGAEAKVAEGVRLVLDSISAEAS
ncbi:MAG: hypothetical protein ABIG03_01550 [Candidatus Eisenbacteria bacterium]